MRRAFLFLLIIMFSCQPASKNESSVLAQHTNDRTDQSSFTQRSKARIKHLSLSVRVDFDSLIIKGVAGYNIERNGEEKIHFDIQDLEIARVLINDSANYREITDASFVINKGNEKGDDLEVSINDYTSTVHIVYKTKPNSKALQWIPKEQTRNKKAGFLYSNGFSDHTRSWIPIQDSPGIRISYEAIIKTPRNVMALMSAKNDKVMNDIGEYTFFQEKTIPPYLIALAVGNIAYNHIIDNLGVYAESSFLIKASDEFEDLDQMMASAESLYGKYQWNRLDVLMMPPSYPLGGMENPQLPFISPTIVAGDKSLTTTLVHELAHAWSSTIVSNATWNDFWLNEGITVYIERRILEELYGKEVVEMQNEIAFSELIEAMEQLPEEDTRLKINLGERNPDDAFTQVPYEKGYFFLTEIEKQVGREQMDLFLRKYFEHFAFRSITTEDFLLYLDEELIQETDASIDIDAWVYSPGIPPNFEIVESQRSVEILNAIENWEKGAEIVKKDDWGSMEKVYFLQHLPSNLSHNQLAELDSVFSFSTSNSELQFEFFKIAIRNDYTELYPLIESYLINIGRNKFVSGLFREFMDQANGGKEKGLEIYLKARPNYHPFTKSRVDEIMGVKSIIQSDSELL